jgi:hypothetical protein
MLCWVPGPGLIDPSGAAHELRHEIEHLRVKSPRGRVTNLPLPQDSGPAFDSMAKERQRSGWATTVRNGSTLRYTKNLAGTQDRADQR